MDRFKIVLSNEYDLELILSLFEKAIAYQKAKGYNRWPLFPRELIATEMREQRHYKLMAGAHMAGVFSVLYHDPAIWKEKDAEPAVYLHRIAVNPDFKNRGLMPAVKEWASQHARETGRGYVRMDTWGDNENLRNYYIRCGFNYLGQQQMEEVNGEPLHYGGPVLSLFELKL